MKLIRMPGYKVNDETGEIKKTDGSADLIIAQRISGKFP